MRVVWVTSIERLLFTVRYTFIIWSNLPCLLNKLSFFTSRLIRFCIVLLKQGRLGRQLELTSFGHLFVNLLFNSASESYFALFRIVVINNQVICLIYIQLTLQGLLRNLVIKRIWHFYCPECRQTLLLFYNLVLNFKILFVFVIFESIAYCYLVKLCIFLWQISICFFRLFEKIALFENICFNKVCLLKSDSFIKLVVELTFALHNLVDVILYLPLSI